MTEVADLYDEWADDYDASYVDWRRWVGEHGALLARALADRGVHPPATLLDCSCGIGTQAIGLALAGYSVTGTDISPREIERARDEATTFGVDVQFGVADLLAPPRDRAKFDAVLSANSLTHFTDEEALERAMTTMVAAVRTGGVVLVTNRDYDALAASRPHGTPPVVSYRGGRQRVSLQIWDWDESGGSYRMDDVLLTRAASPADPHSAGGNWSVRSRSTRLRAWRRADIERAAQAVGLVDLVWTQEDAQPILTARLRRA